MLKASVECCRIGCARVAGDHAMMVVKQRIVLPRLGGSILLSIHLDDGGQFELQQRPLIDIGSSYAEYACSTYCIMAVIGCNILSLHSSLFTYLRNRVSRLKKPLGRIVRSEVDSIKY